MRSLPALLSKRLVFGAATAMLALAGSTGAQAQSTARQVEKPDAAEALQDAGPSVSAAERALILRRLHDMRDRTAGLARPARSSGAAPAARPEPPTDVSAGAAEIPSSLVLARNNRNPKAQDAANSTLAEPVAVNWRKKVLYAGNFAHLERSSDHGATFRSMSIPAGPSDAPIACCDNDMVIDNNGIAFHSLLYVNSAVSNGVVRIFVRPQSTDFATACSYTYDPAGASNNIVPDYPHIALSKNFLYLTVNAVGDGGGFSVIRRYNLAQLRNCNNVTVDTFTFTWGALGQRVWTPAGGAINQQLMMWMHHESDSSIRIYSWPEASQNITSYVRNVGQSVFANPDCRGGVRNRDFIERESAWSIAGFRTRCAIAAGINQPDGAVLACYWHSAPAKAFTNAHIRAAHIGIVSKTVLSQPHIWSNNACYGYPSVTSSDTGAIGFSLAYGGKTGGEGPAVKGAVGMADAFGRNFAIAADGVDMRADGRYGDYMSVQRYSGCGRWFGATSYAWDSGPVDTPSDVNARWVEFGREADRPCFDRAQ